MSKADLVTSSRIILSPLFVALYFAPEWFGLCCVYAFAALLLVFALIELSDLVDGKVARATGTVSDFGKLFDPFADTFARLSYFACFLVSGYMPLWIFLIILYREFGILFLRLLLVQRGIAMGARPGGKAKAVVYMSAGILALAYKGMDLFGLFPNFLGTAHWVLFGAFCLAALASLLSFVDYFIQFRALTKKAP